MIVVCGGVKGGVGKSTLATNLAIVRASRGKDVLLVDGDAQGTASSFTAVRNEVLEGKGGAGYTCIKLQGQAIKTDVLKLAPKYDDVVIDVGGMDSIAQRAALLVADVYICPFKPSSFDLWAIEDTEQLVADAKAFNEKLKAICVINMADSVGKDNAEAAELASSAPSLIYQATPLGNRKAFRNAASQGLAVTELKPPDPKATAEVLALYNSIFLA